MLQLTSRDEAMLDWMNVVRLADVDAIRWALSAYQDDHDGPVSVRRANHWIARMTELGYLGRMRPLYRDRQIVWPTHQSSGRSAPRLFRQTMRHELAVTAAAGRFLALGYRWTRDDEVVERRPHQADGIAVRGEEALLIEVELTVKKLSRYAAILPSLTERIGSGAANGVLYLCGPAVSGAVSREADRVVFREVRPRLRTIDAFDALGQWRAGALAIPPIH